MIFGFGLGQVCGLLICMAVFSFVPFMKLDLHSSIGIIPPGLKFKTHQWQGRAEQRHSRIIISGKRANN